MDVQKVLHSFFAPVADMHTGAPVFEIGGKVPCD
jgi:hypothetical protein